MNTLLILAPLLGVGIGSVAAYSYTRENRRIHFVDRDNLNAELNELDIEIGSVETCAVCGDEINPDNVGSIVKIDGDYRVICQKPTCLDTYDVE
jgi:predicted ABC-type ATPase